MVALRKAKGILTQVHNQNIIIQNKHEKKRTLHDRNGEDREIHCKKTKQGKKWCTRVVYVCNMYNSDNCTKIHGIHTLATEEAGLN